MTCYQKITRCPGALLLIILYSKCFLSLKIINASALLSTKIIISLERHNIEKNRYNNFASGISRDFVI